MGINSHEYRKILEEMVKELDGGREPDQLAIQGLKSAKNALLHCGKQQSKSNKRKRVVSDGKMVWTRAAAAIWTNVLRKYTDPRDEDAFDKAFTMDGQKGYKQFMRKITNVAFARLRKEEDLSDQRKLL